MLYSTQAVFIKVINGLLLVLPESIIHGSEIDNILVLLFGSDYIYKIKMFTKYKLCLYTYRNL